MLFNQCNHKEGFLAFLKMKRQINKIIILLIAISILIIKEGRSQEGPVKEDAGPRDMKYKAGDLKDPFEPVKIEKKIEEQIPEKEILPLSVSALVIQGVVWGSKLPQAIINNEVVKIGDAVAGVSIVDIDKSGVTVSFEERIYSLSSPAVVYAEIQKSVGENLEGGTKDEE